MKLSINDIKQLISGDNNSTFETNMEVGKCYLIRTVTMHYTGRVVSVNKNEIVLADAAWIADTGRFHDSLKSGTFIEVEPYPDGATVKQQVVVDFAPWNHELPVCQI